MSQSLQLIKEEKFLKGKSCLNRQVPKKKRNNKNLKILILLNYEIFNKILIPIKYKFSKKNHRSNKILIFLIKT